MELKRARIKHISIEIDLNGDAKEKPQLMRFSITIYLRIPLPETPLDVL